MREHWAAAEEAGKFLIDGVYFFGSCNTDLYQGLRELNECLDLRMRLLLFYFEGFIEDIAVGGHHSGLFVVEFLQLKLEKNVVVAVVVRWGGIVYVLVAEMPKRLSVGSQSSSNVRDVIGTFLEGGREEVRFSVVGLCDDPIFGKESHEKRAGT